MSSRVLVVDDESNLLRMAASGLRHAGFVVETAVDSDEAMRRLGFFLPDIIILDIGLSGSRDGIDLLGDIRATSDVPVLMLTARTEVDDKVEALASGADDYVTKPFNMAELIARLEAHLRRRPKSGDLLKVSAIELNLTTRRAQSGGQALMLSRREFDLLATLLREPARIFTKDELIERVWGLHADINTETVDRFVSLLRRKLRDVGESKLIVTARGVGYGLGAQS